jgi:hypothetical protein
MLNGKPLLMLNGKGKVYRVIRGDAPIKHNLSPKGTTEFP